jgi:hypothetical protein
MEIVGCTSTRPGHLQFWERDPDAFGAPDQCAEFSNLVATRTDVKS